MIKINLLPREYRGRERLSLKVWGTLLAAVVLVLPSHSLELLRQPVEPLTAARTVSFERLAGLLGAPLPRIVVICPRRAMMSRSDRILRSL